MNDLLFNFIEILDEMIEKFDIETEKDNKYYSAFVAMKKKINDNFTVDATYRAKICDFIISLQIPKLQANIFSILNPNQAVMEADEEYVASLKIEQLSDAQMMKYFIDIARTITMTQKDNLLLVKYSQCIFNTGFHNLAKLCRGKVIDLTAKKIVSYPFDKFFNLNEVGETSQTIVEKLIKEAKTIVATDKKDGSLIAVTKLDNGEILINTNGSFDNTQIDLAKKMLKTKYSDFYKNIKSGKTFVFEIISPEDTHIINYNGMECMFLLAIRDLKTYKLIPYNEMIEFAKENKLVYTEAYEFTSLSSFVKEAENEYENREGWVFRLIGEKFDFMFKLKFKEYFLLHRATASIKIMKVYKLVIGNSINNYLEVCPDNVKEDITSFLEEINIIKIRACNYVEKRALEILAENNLTVDNYSENREKMISLITHILKTEKYGNQIVRYIRFPENKYNLFKYCSPKKFETNLMTDFD